MAGKAFRIAASRRPELTRIAFLDFEASSLGKQGYPIEVAWVFGTGEEESHLIRPAPGWDDWSAEAASVHRIPREQLLAEGIPHDEVARRMVDVLTGCELHASAPSWDGQWLSKLLRAAGLPRHALRLEDTDEAHRRAAAGILERAGVPLDARPEIEQDVIAAAHAADESTGPPLHRALADARREQRLWHDIRSRTEQAAARWAMSA
jgi:hypothetical protein